MNIHEIELPEDKLSDFIKDNFKEDALVEISYNRVFIPGRILYMNDDETLTLTLQLQGELLNQVVDINIEEILHDLVEIHYITDEELIITII